MLLDHARLRALVAKESLPALLVDLDALEENTRRIVDLVRGVGKPLRVASKSVRVPRILSRILALGEGALEGLLCYSALEAAFLCQQGFDHLLVAYPSLGGPRRSS